MDYAALGVASVSLAITENQDEYGGYGALCPGFVESVLTYVFDHPHASPEEISEVVEPVKHPVARFLRPMVIPFWHKYHILLVIVQLNNKRQPEILVLDSRPWTYDRHGELRYKLLQSYYANGLIERFVVYKAVLAIIRSSEWLKVPRGSEIDLVLPESMIWIPLAHQNTDWTCGYHTVFNAWSALLGLEVNLDLQGQWSKGHIFRNIVRHMISIASMGDASSHFIHQFLETIKFVLPGQTVQPERSFTRTTPVLNEFRLAEALGLVRGIEDLQWDRCEGEELEDELGKLLLSNSIVPQNILTEGRPHNTTWPNDSIDEIHKVNALDYITESGERLPQDWNATDLALGLWRYGDGTKQYQLEGLVTMDFLQSLDLRKEIVRKFHEYLSLDRLDLAYVDNNADVVWRRNNKIYQNLRDYMRENAAPGPVSMRASYNLAGEGLASNLIIYAVSAVVRAIDNAQADEARKVKPAGTFTGGLSITPVQEHVHANIARASRPRRCWIKPHQFYDASDKRGVRMHHILTVLQEERKESGDTEFCVYFFDSQPRYLRNRQHEIYGDVKDIAKDRHWSTHRNKTQDIQFRKESEIVPVARQKSGMDVCGYHVVLNAWILALGLTPNSKKTMENSDYWSIHQAIHLSLTGILDWKTLVALLIGSDFITEKSLSDVPLNRHFQSTVAVPGNPNDAQKNLLRDINLAKEDDDALEVQSERDYPYDHTNNVDVAQIQLKQSGGAHETSSLGRELEIFEEADHWPDTDHYQEILRQAWEDRKYAERSARRNRWVNKMLAGGRIRPIRNRRARY